jgi:hypothetical protein
MRQGSKVKNEKLQKQLDSLSHFYATAKGFHFLAVKLYESFVKDKYNPYVSETLFYFLDQFSESLVEMFARIGQIQEAVNTTKKGIGKHGK